LRGDQRLQLRDEPLRFAFCAARLDGRGRRVLLPGYGRWTAA